MNDDKEYDDYIKGLFSEDPKVVPSELKWEAMDFDLSKVIEPKKKSYRTYLPLLFLLLMITSIVCFTASRKIVKQSSTSSPLVQQALEPNIKSTPVLKESEQNNQQINTPINTVQKTRDINVKSVESFEKTTTKQNTTKSITQNVEHSFSKKTLKYTRPYNKEDKASAANTIHENEGIHSSKPITKSTSISTIELQTIKFLPTLEWTNVVSLVRKNIDLGEKITSFPKKKTPIDTTQKIELLVGYGLNSFNLKKEDSNSLEDKVSKAFGHSFRAGVRLRLKHNWTINSILKYDQYHSVFQHTRELEPIINTQNLYRINRKEITYHNNYTNTIGLQLGVEKQLNIFKKLDLYIGLSMTPTYLISAKGKTTDDTTIVKTLNYDNQTSKLSLQAGFNARLVYPMSQVINLEFGYQSNHLLLKEVFINDGIYSTQQRTLFLMLSYRLGTK